MSGGRRVDIAWRNLAGERGRLAISVGGVAFAVLLILLVRGLYSGFTEQATAYVRSVDADVWVAQEGTPGDFFHGVSIIPTATAAELRRVSGVARVTPLLGRPVVTTLGGEATDLFLLGVDTDSGVGGPTGRVEGKRIPGRGELVVDRVFARSNDVSIGDRVPLHGLTLTVTGIASGGNAIISQFAWAGLDDAGKVMGGNDFASYYLVKAEGGVEPARLAARIRAKVADVKPMTTDELAAANTKDISESILPIIWVLMVIAFLIGTAVIGLTIYTATLEKKREYGVLKAVGFSNRRLLGIVSRQALTSSILGLIVGVVLTFVVGWGVERLVPSFVIALRPLDVVAVALAAVLMGAASALVPIRPITRLDPAQVFRV